MLIGVDFDNTIVCYDGIFQRVAVKEGLAPEGLPSSKGGVRDYLRAQGKEKAWIELQGRVYGPEMSQATPFPGAAEFFRECRRLGVAVRIISHRTRSPFEGPAYDLHESAHQWLRRHGFYDKDDIGLTTELVHLELTKEEKLRRIGSCGCTHFIDDLPEFLSEAGFPKTTERILFDPNGRAPEDSPFERAESWEQLTRKLLWKAPLR